VGGFIRTGEVGDREMGKKENETKRSGKRVKRGKNDKRSSSGMKEGEYTRLKGD